MQTASSGDLPEVPLASSGTTPPEVPPEPRTATVVLFKRTGKYYTTEPWRIPEGAISPADMGLSPDWRTIDGGPVLIETQEPWGWPHLFPGAPVRRPDDDTVRVTWSGRTE